VPRTLVSKSDLELIALQEIRHVPGGELVISVEIEHGDAEPDGLNWRLLVIAKDGADLDRLQNAATTTRHRLKRRYQLVTRAAARRVAEARDWHPTPIKRHRLPQGECPASSL
jgi:hypothetical protein